MAVPGGGAKYSLAFGAVLSAAAWGGQASAGGAAFDLFRYVASYRIGVAGVVSSESGELRVFVAYGRGGFTVWAVGSDNAEQRDRCREGADSIFAVGSVLFQIIKICRQFWGMELGGSGVASLKLVG